MRAAEVLGTAPDTDAGVLGTARPGTGVSHPHRPAAVLPPHSWAGTPVFRRRAIPGKSRGHRCLAASRSACKGPASAAIRGIPCPLPFGLRRIGDVPRPGSRSIWTVRRRDRPTRSRTDRGRGAADRGARRGRNPPPTRPPSAASIMGGVRASIGRGSTLRLDAVQPFDQPEEYLLIGRGSTFRSDAVQPFDRTHQKVTIGRWLPPNPTPVTRRRA